MNKLFFWFLFFISLILLQSCKSKMAVVTSAPPHLSPKEIFNSVLENQPKFTWLNGKAATEIETPANSFSVTANFRIKTNETVWVSASPALGVEVARAIITQDSLKLLDRINNEFLLCAFSYLHKYLPGEITYDHLQNLIIGNVVNLREDLSYTSSEVQENLYVITASSNDFEKKIWTDPQSKTIRKFYAEDKRNGQKITATYDNYETENNILFPKDVNIIAEGKQKVTIKLKWLKVNFETPQEFPFNVPQNFEQMR